MHLTLAIVAMGTFVMSTIIPLPNDQVEEINVPNIEIEKILEVPIPIPIPTPTSVPLPVVLPTSINEEHVGLEKRKGGGGGKGGGSKGGSKGGSGSSNSSAIPTVDDFGIMGIVLVTIIAISTGVVVDGI